MGRLLRALFAVFIACASAACAAAQQTIHVPADRPTIQAAIDAAANGDTVLVSPGTYTVSLDFEGKAVTLTTGATSYTQPVVAQTVLQANGVPVAVFYHGEGRGSVINGFTISDPSQPYYHFPPAGGVLAAVLDSNAGYVGGSGITNPLEPAYASPTITNNRFVNDVDAISLSGPEVAGNDFSGCSGADIIDTSYPVTAVQGTLPSIHNNVFENNSAATVVHSFGSIQDNLFQNNAVTGPLLNINYDIDPSATSFAVAERNIFRNNRGAHASLPASSVVQLTARALLFNNLAYGNQVDAVLVVSGEPGSLNTVVTENTFAGNSAAPGCQGTCPATQILFKEKGAFSGNGVLLANNIFQTPSPGPYIVCQDDPQSLGQDTLQVDHNLFSPTTAPLYDANCRPQITNTGNVMADPKFANPAAGDFHLMAGSPAVDTGNNSLIAQLAGFGVSLATDFDGNPRPVDATGLGYPVLDMGAYELPGVADGAPTSLLLVPSSYAPNITQTINFTAQLSSTLGAPVGTVTFLENGKAVATAPVLSNGTATVALPLNTQGIVEFLATYPGDYPFTPASSTKLVLEVALFPTYITLTASPLAAVAGQPVTLSVMAGSTDGTVPSPITLTANGVALRKVLPDASGNASLTVTTLPPGMDTIVATYAGDQHHGPSSATATVTVTLNDFGLALNPPSVTVKAGLSGQVSVLLSSLGLFAGSLHLTAGNLPQYASATFAPGSVALSAGGSTAATLTINTSASGHARLEPAPPSGGATQPVVFALLLLAPFAAPFALRRRVRRAAVGLLLLSSLGCTDIHLPLAKVAPGTYTIPISASDPVTGIIHSATLTLIVTP